MENTSSSSSTSQSVVAVDTSIPVIIYVGYVASVVGCFTNILNILVFLNPKLKDPTYKYMMVNSLVELLFLLIVGMDLMFLCGLACVPNYFTMLGQVWTVWLANYGSRVLAVYNILIEIFTSLQRLMLIKNKGFFKETSVTLVSFVLLVISCLYYLPAVFSYEIIQTYYPAVFLPNSTIIDLTKSKLVWINTLSPFGSSTFGKILNSVLTLFRILCATIFLLIINLLSAIEFQKHLKKKSKLSGRTNADTRNEEFSNAISNKRASKSEARVSVQDSNWFSNKRGSRTEGPISVAESRAPSSHRGSVSRASSRSRASKANRNINMMVMSVSFFYVIGTVPYSVIYIMSQFMTVSDITQLYSLVALNIFHGSNIVMFYAFNKLYRQTLNSYFKSVFGLIGLSFSNRQAVS